MPNFPSYQDRERRRHVFAGAALLGAGAALLIPAVRQKAAGLVLAGLEKAGTRWGGSALPYTLRSTASELSSLVDHQIPNAYRFSTAYRGAVGALTHAGYEAEAAHAIASTAPFRHYMLTGGRPDELLGAGAVSRTLTARAGASSIQAALARSGRAGLPNTARQLAENELLRTLGQVRDGLPTLTEINAGVRDGSREFAAVAAAQAEARRLAQEEVAKRAAMQPGRLGRAFGIEGTRFAGATDPGLLRARDQLLSLGADPAQIEQLLIGGVVNHGGRRYDLRGALALKEKVGFWARNNVQVPLVPGQGISPFQLFPWGQGKGVRQAGAISSLARDPALKAILGVEGAGGVGQDVFYVGDRFFAADFAKGADALTPIEARGEIQSALFGYARRRAQTLEAGHRKADGLLQWLGIGNGGETLGGQLASVAKKYDPASDWAPALFGRILTGDLDQLSVQEIKRAGHFLTARGLPSEIQAALVGRAGGSLPKSYAELIGAVGSDEGLLAFFDHAAAQPGSSPFLSRRLTDLFHQYRSSPREVLGRVQFPAGKTPLGLNLLGQEAPQNGLALMRSAVMDELEEQLSQTEGAFGQWVQTLPGLSAPAKERALAYGHGKSMLRWLTGPAGVPPQEAGPVGARAAAEWLRGNPEAQAAVEGYVARHNKPWHAFHPGEEEELHTAQLFVRKRTGLLESYNRARKEGQGFMGAFWGTVTGDARKEAGAYFTGDQRYTTRGSMALEYLFGRNLNKGLQEFGLGLHAADQKSGFSTLANLFLKRAVPAVGLYELYRYADYKSDQIGIPGPSDLYANVRARMGRSRAKHFGTHLPFLGRRELFPGLDKFLPERDEAEEVEHQRAGYEAVRKGRFWAGGSREEFWGGKVDYFLPSAVNTARSGWQQAANVDLASRRYWEHSWLPLPENFFLGPLRWLGDPYWYENAHSRGEHADRPYLATGEMFDPSTLHGSFLNPTLGWLLKRRQVMHPEYLPASKGGNASQAELRRLNEAAKQGLDMRGMGAVVGGAGVGPGAALAAGGLTSPGVLPAGGGGGAAGSVAVITPAGRLQPMALPDGMDAGELRGLGHAKYQVKGGGARLSRREMTAINRRLKEGAAPGKLRTTPLLAQMEADGPWAEGDADLVNYASGTMAGVKTFSDVAGLYGYFGRTGLAMAGGSLDPKGRTIATASDAYGYQRRFYELGVGGLGGGLSEIGRRFMPHTPRRDRYNPVPNMMPGWLPGPEYVTDFRHGDPYRAIQRGELRLPGEAYERTHPNLQLLPTRASSIGKSVPELMAEMLSLETPMSAYGEEVTELGKAYHQKIERHWKRMGVLLASEQRLENPALGISGHLDAILNTPDGPQVVDIKTVSGKRYQQALRKPFAEHVSQLNFYMHETGVQQGGLLYLNRDDPSQTQMVNLHYSEGVFQAAVGRVQTARHKLHQLVANGTLARGDLYRPIDRFEILSDVAPYSEQYARLREYLVGQHQDGQLSDEENARFQAAKKRAATQKRRLTLYPYRFLGNDTVRRSGTVERILDVNTFVLAGDPHPVRFAAVHTSEEKLQAAFGEAPEGADVARWGLGKLGLHVGGKVTVAVDADPERRYARDVLQTQHAAVFAGGKNLNRTLIDSGIGEERENDYSGPGIAARFSPGEIGRGRAWERFAHGDTPLHNKFMRVRSPLEELERGIVFGKGSGTWQHPVRDHLAPALTSFVAKNPLIAGLSLGAFASLFVKGAAAKKLAFKWGGILGAGLSGARMLGEGLSGETWKPGRTVRREGLEEYWDALKYIKFRGLAAQEERLAKQQEHLNIDRLEREEFNRGEVRKRMTRALMAQKRKLVIAGHGDAGEVAAIDEKLTRLATPKGMVTLGPHATRAMQFRELYRSTLYGIDPGKSPFLSLFKAFPKYKRELLEGVINRSSPKERERVFRLLPQHEQRVIGPYLGIDKRRLPKRLPLRQFFRNHPLPGPNWKGWAPEVDLESLRQLAIRHEGLDPMESGLYPQQIDEAAGKYHKIPIPTLHGKSQHLENSLNQLLAGKGLQQLRISVAIDPHDGPEDDLSVQVRLKERREGHVRDALQLGG